MSKAPEYFKGAMSLFSTGVTVVTTSGLDGSGYGVTVSAFASVSLQPQLILICLDNQSSGLEHFEPGCSFAVNILREDQEEVSNYFATAGTDRTHASGFYRPGDSGTPLLNDRLACIECSLIERIPGGDHTILLGEVTEVYLEEGEQKLRPLVYFRGRYWGLGAGE